MGPGTISFVSGSDFKLAAQVSGGAHVTFTSGVPAWLGQPAVHPDIWRRFRKVSSTHAPAVERRAL